MLSGPQTMKVRSVATEDVIKARSVIFCRSSSICLPSYPSDQLAEVFTLTVHLLRLEPEVLEPVTTGAFASKTFYLCDDQSEEASVMQA
eukprot:765255-Hanusia_phi.AAC.2